MGRARGAARCSGADVGLSRSATAACRGHAGRGADLGISTDRGPGPGLPAPVCTGAELGRPRAGGFLTATRPRSPWGRSRVGWFCCTGAVLGCATGSACAPHGGRSRARGRPNPAGVAAVVGRRPRGKPRAVLGSARGFTSIANPDGAFVEPAGARLERTGAFWICARCAVLDRLGRAAPGVSGATADRRTLVDRARVRGVGRAQDRGAGGTCRAIVVGTSFATS
jgi:hypothetical protein